MEKNLTPAQLGPLLDILRNPENPAFENAVAQLTTLNPSGLSAADAIALMAKLDATLTELAKAKAITAEQLDKLRSRSKALTSYNRVK
jgi:pilus assembly protein TadC